MSQTAEVSFLVDAEVKQDAERALRDMGLSLPGVMTAFLEMVGRDRRLRQRCELLDAAAVKDDGVFRGVYDALASEDQALADDFAAGVMQRRDALIAPQQAAALVDEALASGVSPWGAGDDEEMARLRRLAESHPERRYLTLPERDDPGFAQEKSEAEALGAKYDADADAWYVPAAVADSRPGELRKWL